MTSDAGRIYEELQARSFAAATKATSPSFVAERRMSGAAIARFIADKRYAMVATTRRDGRPHATMTGYFADGATFWLPSVAGAVRGRNVRAQPYAALVIAEGEGDEHTTVIAEGPASVVKALPADVEARYKARSGEPADWIEAWIRLDVDRLYSFAATNSRYSGSPPAV